jgi:hypothetical protein
MTLVPAAASDTSSTSEKNRVALLGAHRQSDARQCEIARLHMHRAVQRSRRISCPAAH